MFGGPDQDDREVMKKLLRVFAIASLLAACPKRDEPEDTRKTPVETGPVVKPTAPTNPDTPTKIDPKALAVDLPAECQEYRALSEKLLLPECDKLGQARDTLKAAADEAWKAWKVLPNADKAGTAPACQAAAQGLKTAAAAACGW